MTAEAKPDKGLKLALSLIVDELAETEHSLNRLRAIFDHDEVPISFTLEHDLHCPWWLDIRLVKASRPCACGLRDTLDLLREECKAVERMRESLARIVGKVEV